MEEAGVFSEDGVVGASFVGVSVDPFAVSNNGSFSSLAIFSLIRGHYQLVSEFYEIICDLMATDCLRSKYQLRSHFLDSILFYQFLQGLCFQRCLV